MFIDTNIFVPARFATAPFHEAARRALAEVGQSSGPACISRQILREYLATVTRPMTWADPMPMPAALRDVEWLRANFEVLEDGPRVTEALLALCREVPVAGKQIHDANIVATMLAHGERRLLTFNGRDFRRYGTRIALLEPGAAAGGAS